MNQHAPEISIDESCREIPSPLNSFLLKELVWEHYGEDPQQPGNVYSNRINDPLIRSCAQLMGGLEGKEVLELGPYEGYHSVALHRHGPARVISIEANPRNYIKCLIVKEFFQLNSVNYLLGDVVSYLQKKPRRFDMILAAGILYHLSRPFETLDLILAMTDAVGICTTYYDPNDMMFKFSGETREVIYPGAEPFVLHKRDNPHVTMGKKHGIDDAAWMFTREDLLKYFEIKGFDVEQFPYVKAKDSGPRVRLLARRRTKTRE